MEPVLHVRAVSRTYRPRRGWLRLIAPSAIHAPREALVDVDLDLRPGERCLLLGRNGAGKTTLFQLVLGLLGRDGGDIRVGGLDPAQDAAARALVGWMPADDRSLVARLTTAENLQLHGRLFGMPGEDLRARIPAVLDQVGLTDRTDDLVASLSAGMRARLQVARALLPRPALLLLDEPTASLDPAAAADVLELVDGLIAAEDVAAVIATHRLDEVERLGGRVVVLERGRVSHDGDVAAVGVTGLERLLGVQAAS